MGKGAQNHCEGGVTLGRASDLDYFCIGVRFLKQRSSSVVMKASFLRVFFVPLYHVLHLLFSQPPALPLQHVACRTLNRLPGGKLEAVGNLSAARVHPGRCLFVGTFGMLLFNPCIERTSCHAPPLPRSHPQSLHLALSLLC